MTKPKKTIEEAIEASNGQEANQEKPALLEPIDFEPIPHPANMETFPSPSTSVTPPDPSLGRKIWRAIIFLFNLILIVLFVSAIGVGIYLGWPIVYERYVQPIENHTVQIAQIEKERAQTNEKIFALQTQVAAVLAERTNQTVAMNELDVRVLILQETQTALQSEIDIQRDSLAALEMMQVAIQANSLEMNSELDRQIKLLRGMELLSRARLFLYQSNFGLAEEDIRAAREILAAIQPSAPLPLASDLSEIVERLDMCLLRLPDFPVPASDDLDIAWQILLQVTPRTALQTETPTPTITPELTEPAKPEITPTSTPETTSTATPQS